MKMRRVSPLMIVEDTTKTLAWYEERGFTAMRDISGNKDEDLHLIISQGEAFAQLMGKKSAHHWLPESAGTPMGFSGWLYLSLDDANAYIESIDGKVEVLKDHIHEHGRLYYFRDLNGYIIGVNQIVPFG